MYMCIDVSEGMCIDIYVDMTYQQVHGCALELAQGLVDEQVCRHVQMHVYGHAQRSVNRHAEGRREDTYFLRPLDVARMLETLQTINQAVSFSCTGFCLGQNSNVVSYPHGQGSDLYIGLDFLYKYGRVQGHVYGHVYWHPSTHAYKHVYGYIFA